MEKVICEIWKDIEGYEGLYQISNLGRVKSMDHEGIQKHWQGGLSHYKHKGKILKPHVRPNGYLCISLRGKDKKLKTHSIHRLVGLHFLEKPEGKDCINHLDANPKNNKVDNLEWCTQKHNIQYAYDHGTKIPPHQKKVGQYDLEGNLIKVWISETEAARRTGAYQSNIHKTCIGKRKQAGGYIWRYIERRS